MEKEKLLVSACLMGENCKYNDGNNLISNLDMLKGKFELIPVCPEQLGGLSTPRAPSEIKDGKVINNEGIDVTEAFELGAKKALEIAKENNCTFCLLKERSPSCGVNYVYNGDFSGTVIEGAGVTAKLLKQHGFPLFTETDLDKHLI